MLYRFGPFSLDPGKGLFRSGKPIPLEPLALELLKYLLENRDRTVAKDELHEQLWQGRIVSDAALSTQVRAVRRALGDDRTQQCFIRTYPRRGLNFAAEVECIGDEFDGPPHRDDADMGERLAERRSSDAKRQVRQRSVAELYAIAFAAALALVTVVVAADRLFLSSGSGATPEISIAVLPFDNLSGDNSLDYLADAFTEDLTTDLSRIRDVFVISRSTTFTYRDREVDVATVAAELDVRYVLEGSLRVDQDNVRINAQLIDGRTTSHIWSDRYDVKLADLFDVQENVTGQISSVLRAELRMAENERQDPDVENDAWDYALRGNVLLYNHETISDYQRAHELLTRAVSLDPTISSAWGGLAFVHFVAGSMTIPGISAPDSPEKSLEAAQRAVRADPNNAEPYWLVGAGYARLGHPERGMPACETALALNPNMDCGHVCAGLVHLSKGDPEKAVPYFRQALRLNPLFRPFTKEKFLGLAYIKSAQDDLAINALNRALSKAPEDEFANLALVAALALGDRLVEAKEALKSFESASGRSPPAITALRTSLQWLGPEVERMLTGLEIAGLAAS